VQAFSANSPKPEPGTNPPPFKINAYALTLLAAICLSFPGSAQHNISVNAGTVLTDVSHHPVGINVSHLMDGTFLQPAPATSTTQALNNMGVKFLRFQEGKNPTTTFGRSPLGMRQTQERQGLEAVNGHPTTRALPTTTTPPSNRWYLILMSS
jgi:hypothetical protein